MDLIKNDNDQMYPESIFDRAWEGVQSENVTLTQVLEALEHQLELTPGFLANDEIITRNIQLALQKMDLSLQKDSISLRREDTFAVLAEVLSELKVMDTQHNTIYGTFHDEYNVYRDNYDNLLYKTYDDDVDDTESLMRCGSIHQPEMSPGSLDIPFDELDDKFTLFKVLDELNSHHINIHHNFNDIDAKLSKLKTQNKDDLEFLDKLNANNELICDRMHDMREELRELAIMVDEIKGEAEDPVPINTALPTLPTPSLPREAYVDVISISSRDEVISISSGDESSSIWEVTSFDNNVIVKDESNDYDIPDECISKDKKTEIYQTLERALVATIPETKNIGALSDTPAVKQVERPSDNIKTKEDSPKIEESNSFAEQGTDEVSEARVSQATETAEPSISNKVKLLTLLVVLISYYLRFRYA